MPIVIIKEHILSQLSVPLFGKRGTTLFSERGEAQRCVGERILKGEKISSTKRDKVRPLRIFRLVDSRNLLLRKKRPSGPDPQMNRKRGKGLSLKGGERKEGWALFWGGRLAQL
jgi:hypothetical protein